MISSNFNRARRRIVHSYVYQLAKLMAKFKLINLTFKSSNIIQRHQSGTTVKVTNFIVYKI